MRSKVVTPVNMACVICGKHAAWGHSLKQWRACERERRRREREANPPDNSLVMTTLDHPKGGSRIMRTVLARHLERLVKGNRARHAAGTLGRFTSETARAARLKGKVKGRKTPRYIKHRSVIREACAETPQSAHGRTYEYFPPIEGEAHKWPPGYWTITDEFGTRIIGETFALRGLGYLPRPTRGVPTKIRPLKRRNG